MTANLKSVPPDTFNFVYIYIQPKVMTQNSLSSAHMQFIQNLKYTRENAILNRSQHSYDAISTVSFVYCIFSCI
jgi:hypothetical protein